MTADEYALQCIMNILKKKEADTAAIKRCIADKKSLNAAEFLAVCRILDLHSKDFSFNNAV